MQKDRILTGFVKVLLIANVFVANLFLMLFLSTRIIATYDYIYLFPIPILLFGFLAVFLLQYVLEIKD